MEAIKIKVIQNTDAWQLARLGNFTASAIAALMGKGRAKDDAFSATGKTYIYKTAYGRLVNTQLFENEDELHYFLGRIGGGNRATDHGHNYEAHAAMRYEILTGNQPQAGGMYACSDLPHLTASPDGLVGEDGLIEIKCPYGLENFVRYAVGIHDGETLKAVNADYYWQVQCQLAVTGRKWCDFIVYDPALISDANLHITRIERNEEDITAMLEKVKLAEQEVTKIVNTLTPQF